MDKEQRAPAGVGAQIVFQPARLPRLGVQARVDERGVDHHEVAVAVVEGVEVFAEVALVQLHVGLADFAGGHPRHRLVAHVVVAGHQVQGRVEPAHRGLEARHRVGVGHGLGHGVDHVAHVHREVGRERVEHVHRVREARVGEPVRLVRRDQILVRRVDVAVGDDGEAEEAGGHARLLSSRRRRST